MEEEKIVGSGMKDKMLKRKSVLNPTLGLPRKRYDLANASISPESIAKAMASYNKYVLPTPIETYITVGYVDDGYVSVNG